MTTALWPPHDRRWKQLANKERLKSARMAKSQRLEPYLLQLWEKAKAGTSADLKRVKRGMSALKRQVYDGKQYIKAWEVYDRVCDVTETVNRPTSASAKYAIKLRAEDASIEVAFADLKATQAGDLQASDSFIKTAAYRKIPFAKPGQLVAVDGRIGWILDFNSDANLDVWMAESGLIENHHPAWKTVYFDDAFVEIPSGPSK